MIQADIRIFKKLLKEMYEYYFNDKELDYNKMIEKLKNHNIEYKTEEEMNVAFDRDKEAIDKKILEEDWGDQKSFIKDLVLDFWIDLSPTYCISVKDEKID